MSDDSQNPMLVALQVLFTSLVSALGAFAWAQVRPPTLISSVSIIGVTIVVLVGILNARVFKPAED